MVDTLRVNKNGSVRSTESISSRDARAGGTSHPSAAPGSGHGGWVPGTSRAFAPRRPSAPKTPRHAARSCFPTRPRGSCPPRWRPGHFWTCPRGRRPLLPSGIEDPATPENATTKDTAAPAWGACGCAPAPSPGVVRLGCLVHPGCAGHRLGQDATGTVNQGGSARSGGPATRAPHLPSTGNPLGRGRCCDAQLSLCMSVMCAALAKSSCQSSGGAATFAGQHVHSRVGGRQPRQRPEVPPRPAAPPWTSGGGHEEELSSPGTTISHRFRRDGARDLDGALAPARGQVGHPPKQQ